LAASIVAGVFWDKFGAPVTFYASAVFCVLALLGLLWRPAKSLV